MKIYVINLAKNKERMRNIDSILKSQDLLYERMEAVSGKDLTSKQKHKFVSYFNWWCVNGTKPRDGEIGCALSHQTVYKKLIESREDCCCILEDDAGLQPCFREQIERIEKWINAESPQVVLMTNYTKETEDSWAIRECMGDSSTEAYVITKVAALNLLKRNNPICTPSDGWRFWRKKGVLRLYHAYPTVVQSTWQLHLYPSDVCPRGETKANYRSMNMIGRIYWKISRVVGVMLSRLFV